jgi:hypothetical protein
VSCRWGSEAATIGVRARKPLSAVVVDHKRRSRWISTILVVGLLGSRDWVYSTHGRKIEKVVKNKRKGAHCMIVSEKHWAE